MHPRKSFQFLGLVTCFVGSHIHAADFSMSYLNSSAQVNITNAGAGIVSWTTDGVNYLNQQSYFFRVGAVGPEAKIQTISSTPTVSFTQVPNILSSLDATYANSSYSVRTLFNLTGGNPGSGKSSLGETITVRNLSGASLDFHLFQYSDFDIWGLSGGQSAQFYQNSLTGGYNLVKQTDGTRQVTQTVGDGITPISHFEAGLASATLTSLTDGGPTTLSDTQSAGPGNATYAYQWDVTLAAGESFQLSILTTIPEPTTATLILIAGAVTALVRRKQTI